MKGIILVPTLLYTVPHLHQTLDPSLLHPHLRKPEFPDRNVPPNSVHCRVGHHDFVSGHILLHPGPVSMES